MNNNDIFNALSGIDEKYIDEAAYELHTEGKADVVNITSKRSISRFVKIALPSVAAIILIAAFALPAVLRVTKSDSAAMSDATAAGEAPAVAEEAAPSYDEAAAPAAEENDSSDAEAPAMAESADEAAPAMSEEAATETSGAAAESEEAATDSHKRGSTLNAAAGPLEITEADYRRDILVIRFKSDLPEDIKDMDYRLTMKDGKGAGSLVSEGKLSELSDHIDITDNWLVIDLNGHGLAHGTYRLGIGDTYAEFNVP